MDPNAAYDELCSILDRMDLDGGACERAEELIDALLVWTGRGGFLPEAAEHQGFHCFRRMVSATKTWLECVADVVEG